MVFQEQAFRPYKELAFRKPEINHSRFTIQLGATELVS